MLTAPRAGVAPGSDRAAAAPADLPVPRAAAVRAAPAAGPTAAPAPARRAPGQRTRGVRRWWRAGSGAAAPVRLPSGAATAKKPGAYARAAVRRTEARSLLRSGQRPQALALLERTAGEVATRVPADAAAQATIARVYAEAGAVTAADRTLARAGDAPAIRQAAAEVLRTRRRMGLPKSVARFQLPPSAEPDYAETLGPPAQTP